MILAMRADQCDKRVGFRRGLGTLGCRFLLMADRPLFKLLLKPIEFDRIGRKGNQLNDMSF